MIHHKISKITNGLSPLISSGVIVVAAILLPISTVSADIYEQQIQQKLAEQQRAQGQSNKLGQRASGIQGEIDKLQEQIAEIQAKINTNTKRHEKLKSDIKAAEAELKEQRRLLTANIRSMYIEGDITPLEMVASSKNVSDFVEKQEYRDRIKDSISAAVDKIEELKEKLDAQKKEIEGLLKTQKSLKANLDAKNAEASAKLRKVNITKSQFDASVRQKSAEIEELREQQRIANARFIGAPGTGPACGGGYPGRWCNIPMDSAVDDWGMYNRQCVSYTAFRVAASGRHMPHWGGRGNAHEWDDSARADGIPVGTKPKAGSVAISHGGYYGHAMYVESVNGDGTINISQYNADWQGTYSYVTGVSPAGLVFIYF